MLGLLGAALGIGSSLAGGKAASSAADSAQGAYQGFADFLKIELDRQQKFYDQEFNREDGSRKAFGKEVKGLAKTINAGDSAAEAARDNISLLPKLGLLTEGLQGITNDVFASSREKFAPGILDRFKENFSTVAGAAQSLTEGNIPDDVAAEIQDRAAERSQRTGINTSGIGENSVLRLLGISSLQGLQMGDQLAKGNLDFARSFSPMVSPMDLAPMVFSNPALEMQGRAQRTQFVSQLPWFTPKTLVSRIPIGQAQASADGVPAGAMGAAGASNLMSGLGSYITQQQQMSVGASGGGSAPGMGGGIFGGISNLFGGVGSGGGGGIGKAVKGIGGFLGGLFH